MVCYDIVYFFLFRFADKGKKNITAVVYTPYVRRTSVALERCLVLAAFFTETVTKKNQETYARKCGRKTRASFRVVAGPASVNKGK